MSFFQRLEGPEECFLRRNQPIAVSLFFLLAKKNKKTQFQEKFVSKMRKTFFFLVQQNKVAPCELAKLSTTASFSLTIFSFNSHYETHLISCPTISKQFIQIYDHFKIALSLFLSNLCAKCKKKNFERGEKEASLIKMQLTLPIHFNFIEAPSHDLEFCDGP